MNFLHWIFRNLKLDDNNEIDLGFGVVTLCILTIVLSFCYGIFYFIIGIYELCFLLTMIFFTSLALYFYCCRRNRRAAYIAAYWSMNVSCVLVHFFTTYYVGDCGTVFFVIMVLLAPHMYPLTNARNTLVMDIILVIIINLTYWFYLFSAPMYADFVGNIFRIIVSNTCLLACVFLLYINVSAQDFIKESRQKLIDEASKEVVLDALTGLGNRRMLEQYRSEFEQTVSQEYPLSLAAVDIDFFKNINDAYGHTAGDKILEFIAKNMKDSFRKSDLLIRWGGEEFLILLRRTRIEHAVIIMENFRLRMQNSPIIIDGVPIYIRLTIGVKEHRPHTSLDDSIKKADELMYQGKLQGRNRVVVEEKT